MLENIPYVKIPNIDNLLNQSQNGVVMYSDIALDPSLKTQSGDIGSNTAHGSMNIDCVTTSNGEQQPNLKSPDLKLDSKILGDAKEITTEVKALAPKTVHQILQVLVFLEVLVVVQAHPVQAVKVKVKKKPESLAADGGKLKGAKRNEKENKKPNVHNSVDKPDTETGSPPEPENNDILDPETASPPEPENNDKPDPETGSPPEPDNKDSVPPDDVFGECLLLEKLMRAKETESLSCPSGGKVQTYSKFTFMMLQHFITLID